MTLAIRAGSILILGLLAAYYVLRGLASGCDGPLCEQYIAPSLQLPLLILAVAAVTGLLALSSARRGERDAQNPAARRRYATWLGVLGACTMLTVLGPVASVVIWRDHPDTVVLLATMLMLLLPVSALAFSFLADRIGARS